MDFQSSAKLEIKSYSPGQDCNSVLLIAVKYKNLQFTIKNKIYRFQLKISNLFAVINLPICWSKTFDRLNPWTTS